MKNVKNIQIVTVFVCVVQIICESNFKIINKDELINLLSIHQANNSLGYKYATTNITKQSLATIPSDNGGNYGDLIISNTNVGDILLIRETLINEFVSSEELDMFWYASVPAKLSKVQTLNFGRERGYTLQIITRENEGYVEVYVRIPPYKTIRMFIEVYGFPQKYKHSHPTD